jgi:hypothetical protein
VIVIEREPAALMMLPRAARFGGALVGPHVGG